MTPQPRHLDTAKKLASDHFAREQRGETPIGWKHVQEIAAALAEAENRAAWDVKQNQPDESTYEWLEAKYGPRPTTEKQA